MIRYVRREATLVIRERSLILAVRNVRTYEGIWVIFRGLEACRETRVSAIRVNALSSALAVIVVRKDRVNDLLTTAVSKGIIIVTSAYAGCLLLPVNEDSVIVDVVRFIYLCVTPGVVNEDRVRDLKGVIRACVAEMECIRALLVILTFLNNGRGRAVNDLKAVSDYDENVARGVGALSVIEDRR